jgi:hypothetical protein
MGFAAVNPSYLLGQSGIDVAVSIGTPLWTQRFYTVRPRCVLGEQSCDCYYRMIGSRVSAVSDGGGGFEEIEGA